MGIKGLNKFLKEYSKQTSLEKYQGRTFAIDISIFLYKYKYGVKSTDQFIKKFNYQLNQFEKLDITPIYIFDGPAPIEKKITQEKRRETAKTIENTIVITKEDILAVKELFRSRDIQYHIAVSEAEKFCSFLNWSGKIDVCVTNDLDSLLFGAQTVLTSSKEGYFEYNLTFILDSLKLTMNQLIDLGIACGCDYCPSGVPGLGPKKALNYIRGNGPIERWDNLPETLLTDNLLARIKGIFKTFEHEEILAEQVFTDEYSESIRRNCESESSENGSGSGSENGSGSDLDELDQLLN